jgi:uncharacterized protein with HEPN domain
MRLEERDLACFIDIVECIIDIIQFTKGVSFIEFENDKMRKLAVERQLEVLGQAANGILEPTQEQYHFLPWARMIGLRNKLAHDYGEILAKRIWEISKNSIPALLEDLKTIPEIRDYVEKRPVG